MTDIINVIYEAIDEVNETLDTSVEKNETTVLFGNGATLDSIGLISLIVTIERLIDEKHSRIITLASEKAFSRSSSPFRTVKTLAEYTDELLSEV